MRVIQKIRRLRGDDKGQVLMTSGVMMFFVFIVFTYSINTAGVLRRRIQMQNAVDSGAIAGALWQARGLNLVQMLNNFHYNSNDAIAKLMNFNYGVCVSTIPAKACCFLCVFGAPAACFYHDVVACPACRDGMPLLDNAQNIISEFVTFSQDAIVQVIPGVTVLQANYYAEINGADPALGVISEAASTLFNLPSVTLPDPVYILPLNLQNLFGLGLSKSGGSYPWNFRLPTGQFVPATPGCGPNSPSDGELGWKDEEFYCGQPGVLTWMSLSNSRPEILGLGLSPWMADIAYGWAPMEEYVGGDEVAVGRDAPRFWFEQGGNSYGREMEWPIQMVLASSQVDSVSGKNPLVNEKGPADFYPRLVPVNIGGSSLFSGISEAMGIFH